MPKRSKSPSETNKMHYTYRVIVSIEMQYTFEGHEVGPSGDGSDENPEPTAEALKNLEIELGEYLGENYAVDNVDAWAESDNLLGSCMAPSAT